MECDDNFYTPFGQQRNPARIPVVLEAIKEIWEKNPDLRLGQLIYITIPSSQSAETLFNVEDGTLLKRLKDTFSGNPGVAGGNRQ